MRIRLKDLRYIIREVAGPDEFGVYIDSENDVKVGLIYSTTALIQGITAALKGKNPEEEDLDTDQLSAIAKKAARGMIKIAQPGKEDPSNGAWEVVNAAGKGLGKVVYNVGYAMAPDHALMPDRHSVSGDARGAWKKQFDVGRQHKKIDDVEHPKTPDKSDDGIVHNDNSAPWLDYAYWGNGEGVNAMVINHKNVTGEVAELLKPWYGGSASKAAERLLVSVAEQFFNDAYHD